MGLMVIHGAQAGGFSPISIYGGITNRIVAKAGLPLSEIATFLASFGVNLARRDPALLRARRRASSSRRRTCRRPRPTSLPFR